ncbi:MAG: response regulator transcription factor [Acidobacteriota bacterium]
MTLTSPIRVHLLHRYHLLEQALAATLEPTALVELIASSNHPAQLFDALEAQPVDILLIDGSLPRDALFEIIRDVHDAFPDLKILPMGLSQEEVIVSCIEAGACAYVPHEASFEELVETIESVYLERAPCSPEVAASAFARLAQLSREYPRRVRQPLPASARLTPREFEVLKQLAIGLRNKEIAQRLDITLPTVKNHVHKILSKLKVKSRREAIQLAYETGLLEGSPI